MSFELQLYRVGMGARYCSETLTAHISIAKILMLLNIFEELSVTLEPIKGVFNKGIVYTFTDALFAAAVKFKEACLRFRT